MNYKQIFNEKRKTQSLLNVKKQNAHVNGQTTRHRIGAKDSAKSKIRTACQKLDKILMYKRQLINTPELIEVINDVELPKEMLKPWLLGSINSKAFDRFLI